MKYVDPDASSSYSVEMGKHRNVVDFKQSHTIYEVIVTRSDGAQWRVEARYSDISRVRRELVEVIPSIASVPFPKKTYFDWMGFMCLQSSRFDHDRIVRRKMLMGYFLNRVLEKFESIRSESLNRLLNIPVN